MRLIDAGVNGVVSYSAEPGETNAVRVSFTNAAIVIDDVVPIRSLDSRCFINSAGDGICPGSADSIGVFMGDRNDTIQYKAPHEGFVVGGDGADVIFAGLRQAGFGRAIEPVTYRGKDSVLRGETPDFARDTVTYVFADRAVKVNLADQNDAATSSDGRPGIDREQIEDDIELVEGSNFDDVLLGSDRAEAFRGLNGNDVIGAGGGNDVVDEGSAPNGADTLSGGTGTGDRVSHGTRTTGGVDVSPDGVRNDGATGEQDNVSVTVENIGGTNLRDVLSGSSLANTIDGFGGPDTIDGLGGNDTLSAGAANNSVVGGTGNDVIFARNGQIDNVDCGDNTDTDTLDRDTSENRVKGCERVQVGALRLAPKAVHAEPGRIARVKLSWRHPVVEKLRQVELRLVTQDGVAVGKVTIRPRARRIVSPVGAVKLVRKQTRVRPQGQDGHHSPRHPA